MKYSYNILKNNISLLEREKKRERKGNELNFQYFFS